MRETSGKHGTNYVGNNENILSPKFLADPVWLGDVVLKTWTGNTWQKETTAHSGDVRHVEYNKEKKTVEVTYNGESSNFTGLKSVNLHEAYHFVDDALNWDTEITNPKNSKLEIGELAFPFTMNTDFSGIFQGEHHVLPQQVRNKGREACQDSNS